MTQVKRPEWKPESPTGRSWFLDSDYGCYRSYRSTWVGYVPGYYSCSSTYEGTRDEVVKWVETMFQYKVRIQ